MVTDRLLCMLLGSLLLLVLGTLVGVGIDNIKLNRELSEAKNDLATAAANNMALASAVQEQNIKIDELQQESIAAAFRYEQSVEASAPFIEEEERRILGIRNAPPSEDCEQIRQKMLQDAML